MSDTTPPKAFRRPVAPAWFLSNQNYFVFMMRELSAIPVAGVVLLQLYLVYQLGQGPAAFEEAMALYSHPLVIVFHAVALVFVLLHATTWFKLNAKILEIRTGETALPPAYMVTASYVGWAVFSLGAYWLLLG